MSAQVLLIYKTSWGKELKCKACRAFYLFFATSLINSIIQEHEGASCSVVECLTRDRRDAALSLTGFTALWSLSKTHLS